MANDGNYIYTYPQHCSLPTLKQSGFYPFLTCPPSRIWCKDQPPTPETSVAGCASRNNPWQLVLGDAACIMQRGPRATGNSLPRSGRNLIATTKVQLLQGRVPQDFQQVCGPIGTFGVLLEAPGVLKRGLWGSKDGNLLPLLLQMTFASTTICNCLFHIFGLSMLPNVVKETAVTMALTFEKKNTASNELAKHCNQVCKTRHSKKIASLKLVQLAPRSFCHAVDRIAWQLAKFNFSRGELRKTSSRSAAPSAPLVSSSKHLECSKGDCGDQRTAICCRSSCKWLLQVRPFATVYFTFLAFQCCQMLSRKQPWQWP